MLVGAQVAASIVLLAHASLLARSVYTITTTDSGLTRRHGDHRLSLAACRTATRTSTSRPIYRQALDRVRAVPGVTAAAFSTFKPEGGALPREADRPRRTRRETTADPQA